MLQPPFFPIRVVTVALAACLMAMSLPAQPRAHMAPLQIEHTAIEGSQVTVTGRNFGSAPTVTIGDSDLSIVRSSDTEIVADGAPTASGIYALRVSRNGGATEEDVVLSSITVR